MAVDFRHELSGSNKPLDINLPPIIQHPERASGVNVTLSLVHNDLDKLVFVNRSGA